VTPAKDALAAAAEARRLRGALETIAQEADLAGSALCAHELAAILENIRRCCAEALSERPGAS
jgi:hypothetical protein